MLTHEQWTEYRRVLKENAAMRAIVENLAYSGDATVTAFCRDHCQFFDGAIHHANECTVTQARALVAQWQAETAEREAGD